MRMVLLAIAFAAALTGCQTTQGQVSDGIVAGPAVPPPADAPNYRGQVYYNCNPSGCY